LKYSDSVFSQLIPVQIIGTQRSGSNLLRLMLNQLPGVFAPHPPHILATFSKIISYYEDLSREGNFLELVRDICEFVQLNPVPWRNDTLDPGLIRSHCREESLFEVYKKIYEINALSHGATWWFNKSMQNVYFLDDFAKRGFYPYLIHLVRDGRDVALSFKRAIVGDKHVYSLAKKWREDQELSALYVRAYDQEKAITIYYEDLLQNPENEIRKICGLLNIPYSGSILKYYESEESLLTARSGEMWRNLTRPIIADNYNKFKKGLSPEEVMFFERIAGDTLTAHGYVLENSHSSADQDFTDEEISKFYLENERMKKEFKLQASPMDLLKREKQEAFLQKIFERKSISIRC
jgi:hypothetical protein